MTLTYTKAKIEKKILGGPLRKMGGSLDSGKRRTRANNVERKGGESKDQGITLGIIAF